MITVSELGIHLGGYVRQFLKLTFHLRTIDSLKQHTKQVTCPGGTCIFFHFNNFSAVRLFFPKNFSIYLWRLKKPSHEYLPG